MGVTVKPTGLGQQRVCLRAARLTEGAYVPWEAWSGGRNQGSLCTACSIFPACLGFSICQCGPWSGAVCPGASGCSWWRTQVPGVKGQHLRPQASPVLWTQPRRGLEGTHGRWVGHPGGADPALPAVTRCPSGPPRPAKQASSSQQLLCGRCYSNEEAAGLLLLTRGGARRPGRG